MGNGLIGSTLPVPGAAGAVGVAVGVAVAFGVGALVGVIALLPVTAGPYDAAADGVGFGVLGASILYPLLK